MDLVTEYSCVMSTIISHGPLRECELVSITQTGGRLAVIDFLPRSGHTAPAGSRDNGADHGILPVDLIRELSAAGFTDVQQVPWSSPGYFAIEGRRPHRGSIEDLKA
jgi:hypothetical protein